jgi:hypothetical protein
VTTTTTVTNTNISAPILASTGSITWVSGIPVPTKGKAPKSGGNHKNANDAGGWIKCTATSHSSVQKASAVRCPVIPPGSTTRTRRRPRLLCEPNPQPARSGATAPAKQPADRQRTAHYVVYCRGI